MALLQGNMCNILTNAAVHAIIKKKVTKGRLIMKKLTLPVLLLTAAMLVACDSGTTVILEKTTDPTTTSLVLSAPTTDIPTTAPTDTTLPDITTAPISYPVLYERPEITVTHDDVVSVNPITSFQKINDPIFPGPFSEMNLTDYDLSVNNLVGKMTDYPHIVALITPLEIDTQTQMFRVAIDYVFKVEPVHEPPVVATFPKAGEEVSAILAGNFMHGYGWSEGYQAIQIYNDYSIPITTTGGKYVAVMVDIGFYAHPDDEIHNYYFFPLTWELDMDSVPGSTGDDWNRPPYIGKAEYYYAFGFGDVWERYMAK